MKAEQNVEVTVKLELSLEEAKWLKRLVQNPITCYQGDPTLEEPRHQAMRANFWNALKDVPLD